jgi:hypothetical protein
MLKYIFVVNPPDEINWFDFKKGDTFQISNTLLDYHLGYSICYTQHKKSMVSFMREEVFENYKPFIILYRRHIIKNLLEKNKGE